MNIDEWLIDRDRTHWEGCEEHHMRCAVAKTLAARDAEIERLKADAEIGRRWRENSSLEEWFPFSSEEISRLKADLDNLKAHCRTEHQMRVEAEALVEKRERQLVWVANHVEVTSKGTSYEKLYLILDGVRTLDWDGTDAGLLAAIDEAEAEKT